MVSSNSTRSILSDTPEERGAEARRFLPLWNGALSEFRNHLTELTAATNELRTEIPPALVLQVGDAIWETEHNVQSLTALVALMDACVDASSRVVDPTISLLGEVVDRALGLAAPVTGRGVSITTNVPRAMGVRNCGAALECLLAALMVDLARARDGRVTEATRSPRLRIDAEVERRGLLIEVTSDGARPDPGSWRFLLASELAAKLGATLTQPDAAGVAAFVIQLR